MARLWRAFSAITLIALATMGGAPTYAAVTSGRLGVGLTIVETCSASAARAEARSTPSRPAVQVACAANTPVSVSVVREQLRPTVQADVVTVTY